MLFRAWLRTKSITIRDLWWKGTISSSCCSRWSKGKSSRSKSNRVIREWIKHICRILDITIKHIKFCKRKMNWSSRGSWMNRRIRLWSSRHGMNRHRAGVLVGASRRMVGLVQIIMQRWVELCTINFISRTHRRNLLYRYQKISTNNWQF